MTIDFEKMGGLVPAIIQDAVTSKVLMLGFMNKEAYDKVHPDGPVCHLGTDTCWAEENELNPILFFSELQDFINKRHEEMPEGSYTTSLFRKGVNKMAQKVGEEAVETVIEATNGTNENLIYEASDLMYHLIVLLTSKGLRIEDIARELAKRHNPEWDKARRIKKSQE